MELKPFCYIKYLLCNGVVYTTKVYSPRTKSPGCQSSPWGRQ